MKTIEDRINSDGLDVGASLDRLAAKAAEVSATTATAAAGDGGGGSAGTGGEGGGGTSPGSSGGSGGGVEGGSGGTAGKTGVVAAAPEVVPEGPPPESEVDDGKIVISEDNPTFAKYFTNLKVNCRHFSFTIHTHLTMKCCNCD
jgi:hypothetical protein